MLERPQLSLRRQGWQNFCLLPHHCGISKDLKRPEYDESHPTRTPSRDALVAFDLIDPTLRSFRARPPKAAGRRKCCTFQPSMGCVQNAPPIRRLCIASCVSHSSTPHIGCDCLTALVSQVPSWLPHNPVCPVGWYRTASPLVVSAPRARAARCLEEGPGFEPGSRLRSHCFPGNSLKPLGHPSSLST